MKNNNRIILAAVLFASILFVNISGCAKPDDNIAPTHCTNGTKDADETGVDCGGSCNDCSTFSLQVKTIDYNGNTDSIIYDNQKRQLSSLSAGSVQVTYSYENGQVISNYSLGPTDHKVTYTLNNQGYATSAIDSFSNGTVLQIQYSYNAEGHLTAAIITNPANATVYDSTIYTWLDGNLVNWYNSSHNSPAGSNMVITYLANSTNTIGNNNKGLYLWGKDSKNLESGRSQGVILDTYSYEYDSFNRVSKKRNNGTIIETYTYY